MPPLTPSIFAIAAAFSCAICALLRLRARRHFEAIYFERRVLHCHYGYARMRFAFCHGCHAVIFHYASCRCLFAAMITYAAMSADRRVYELHTPLIAHAYFAERYATRLIR